MSTKRYIFFRTAILLFFIVIYSCSDDSPDDSTTYSTPVEIKSYLEEHLTDGQLTYDTNGSAIRKDQLIIQFINPGDFPSFAEKEQFLIEAGDEIAVGLVESVTPCMCGDQLVVVGLDPDIVEAEGGVEEVAEKIKTANGGVVETTKNFIITNELEDYQNSDENDLLGFTDFYNDEIIIAIIDSGFESLLTREDGTPYADLSLRMSEEIYTNLCLEKQLDQTNSVFYGYDLVSNNNNPYDIHSHGTHVTSIIVSELDKIAGNLDEEVIPYYLLPVRTHNAEGISSYFNSLCAMYFAIEMGANVINCSWGFYGLDEDELMKQALTYALASDVIVVAALGNDVGDIVNHPHIPSSFANMQNVIAVGAFEGSADNYQLAPFSNYLSSQNAVLLAPGTNISAAAPAWFGSDTMQKTGTSMATPHVTAAVAYLLAQGNSIEEVKSILFQNGDQFEQDGNNYVVYNADIYFP